MSTILVVDDEYAISEALCGLLEDIGHHCETAADGQEGLLRMQEHQPDLVITDVMMPVLDGFEMVRRMKDDDALRGAPVIVMSAAAATVPDDVQSNVRAFLRKPFAINDLIKLVDGVLGDPTDG